MTYLHLESSRTLKVTRSLNQVLANLHVHYQNLRSAHWNIKGVHFFNLHTVFEQDYNEVKDYIDEVAERIRTLKNTPISKLSDILDESTIRELEELSNSNQMVSTLLKDKSVIIQDIRQGIEQAQDAEDEGSIDLLGSLLGKFEKRSWMYDTWLNVKDVSFSNQLSKTIEPII